jgi:hypothetical protein
MSYSCFIPTITVIHERDKHLHLRFASEQSVRFCMVRAVPEIPFSYQKGNYARTYNLS